MKKFIGVVLISLICITPVKAEKSDFTWGMKAGLNLSGISGNKNKIWGILPRYHFGLVGEYLADTWFAVAAELLLSVQGADYKVTKDSYMDVYYIALPLMVRFYPVHWLSIETGPQLGIAVDITTRDNGKSYKLDSYFYNKFDCEWTVGCTGYFKRYFASIRGAMGWSNILQTEASKNYNFQFSIGMKF